MSVKEYGFDAGFRGIGRLAGVAYCKRLIFSTSFPYEDALTKITFDCDGIRRAISPAMRQVEELSKVMEQHTEQDLFEAKKEDYFFEVRMEGIKVPEFLDHRYMEEYLSQVAPVAFDAQRFTFATKIEEWARDAGIRVPVVRLLLRTPSTEREVLKPYKSHYRTKRKDYSIEIKDVAFLPVGNTPIRYWAWYAHTDLLGMFDDETVAGLRFRRNNIGVGGQERVSELFPGNEGRLNLWTMGEIHILSQEIVPNARRDGFEATDAWNALKSDLEPFIREHCKACHVASSSEDRPTAKILSSAKAAIESAKKATKFGLASEDEREEMESRLQREVERVSAAVKTKPSEGERQQLQSVLTSLKAMQQRAGAEETLTVKKLKSTLDRKQRKVLIDTLEIIHNTLSSSGCPKSKQCLESIKEAMLKRHGSSG
jgi:molecular chaperone HtpG